MHNLVLAAETERSIEQFLAQPGHALLIIGPAGAGKASVANAIAAQLLAISEQDLVKYPYVEYLAPTKGTISIDDIRRLQQTLKLRTLGSGQAIRRIVIIEDAGAMTTEAQNALLKSLEEPPADTVIILTATSRRSLLPTIASRAQQLRLDRPPLEALQQHFATSYSDTAVVRTYRLSGGLPGLMTALLEGDQDHPLVLAVENVKSWLKATKFERLLLVDELIKQKADLEMLFDGLERASQAALSQAAEQGQLAAVKRWQHILGLTVEAKRAMARHAQPKLLLTHIMLEL